MKKDALKDFPASSAPLTGDRVRHFRAASSPSVNRQKEDLGTIEHLMIDLENGRVAYAVLSFGGFLGMGDKLFAIPWSALTVDTTETHLLHRVGGSCPFPTGCNFENGLVTRFFSV
jgi:PRC-barrel domain